MMDTDVDSKWRPLMVHQDTHTRLMEAITDDAAQPLI